MCSVRHFPLTGAMDKTSSPAAGFTLKSEENHSPNCRQDKQALIFCSLTSSERRILYPDKTALHDSIYLFIFCPWKTYEQADVTQTNCQSKDKLFMLSRIAALVYLSFKESTLLYWNISRRGRFQLILFTADWSFVGNSKKHEAFLTVFLVQKKSFCFLKI